ncbi:MAG: SBBP repeat-containing protein [Xanthomonadaceae bacterium]|nr:SBBP repeat-containing protein [Xanthomonadaceae bacterium]
MYYNRITHISSILLTVTLSSGCFPTLKAINITKSKTESSSAFSLPSFIKQFGLGYPGIISSNNDEIANCIAIDSLGNTYMAGSTGGNLADTLAGGTDAWVSKTDSSGNLQWIKQFVPATFPVLTSATGSESIFGIALDSSANVYVTGRTNGNLAATVGGSSDAFIAKLDTNGNLLWIRQLTTALSALILSATGFDQGSAIAVDSAGNSFITGYTASGLAATNAGNDDAWIAKFNTSGTIQWIRQLTPIVFPGITAANLNDIGIGIALDSSGDPSIAGRTQSSMATAGDTSNDMFVAKFGTAAGDLTWIQQLRPTTSPHILVANNWDEADAIAIDSSGNHYIAGYSGGGLAATSGGGADIVIAKLSSGGALTWIKQFTPVVFPALNNAGGGDYATSITLDSSANIYFSGHTQGSLVVANAGSYDMITGKMDSSGNLLWIRQLTPAFSTKIIDASTSDQLTGVAVDILGNSYSAGITYNSANFASASGGFSDIVTFRLDTNGNL